MSEQTKPRSIKTAYLWNLGFVCSNFLVTMAFLAVNSDAKNQENINSNRLT